MSLWTVKPTPPGFPEISTVPAIWVSPVSPDIVNLLKLSPLPIKILPLLSICKYLTPAV